MHIIIMYVCMHIYMYVHYMYMCGHVCIYTCTCTWIHIYVLACHVHVYVHSLHYSSPLMLRNQQIMTCLVHVQHLIEINKGLDVRALIAE